MQSLKSTVVAAMLLALSFGMYQMSETPHHDADESLIPVIDIADGLDQLQTAGANLFGSDRDHAGHDHAEHSDHAPKKLALPDLKQPLTIPQFANTTPAAKLAGADGTMGANFSANQFVSAAANAKRELPRVPLPDPNNSQSFAYPDSNDPKTAIPKMADSANSSNPLAGSKASERQLLGSDQDQAMNRDQGLMAALESQLDRSTDQAAPNVIQNKSDQFQFASTAPPATAQAISASDSSMNQFASSTTDLDRGLLDSGNVFQAGSEPDMSKIAITAAWPTVDKLVAEEKYREALKLLTRFYGSGEMIGPQRQRLLSWLDALAGKVIFSSEHHFRKQPYVVAANESLSDIAARWKVPGQLIYNVNQKLIPNPAVIAAGTQIKAIDAPFTAEIGLRSHVMTLFVDGLYAGRYPIRTGISGDPRPGEYQVLAKAAEGFRWRDSNGTDYPPGSDQNGYGPHWIGLSGSLCLHAVKDDATDGHHGCLGLSTGDAADIFNILSDASTVTIFP